MENEVKEFYQEDLVDLMQQGFNYFILFKQKAVSHDEMALETYEILPVKLKQEAETISAFMGEECSVRSALHDHEYLALASSGALKERFYIPLYENKFSL